MKKAIYIFALISLFSLSFMPAVATTVTTGLTQDTTGGAKPIAKAKWEMNGPSWSGFTFIGTGTDDSSAAGAQFNPSGIKDKSKTITLCSIATDPDGLADINSIYGDVFYPVDVELGDSHKPLSDQSGLGCGELMQEDRLRRLSKADGLEIFCNKIRNNNNNLPTFASPYDYDEICKLDGELQKETAAVYCVDKDLSYEDPSGKYEVWAVPQDKVGLQDKLINQFTYLPLTAFETDFTSINYGNVRLNTHKIINGDLTWDALNQGLASVRNVGNTRLTMKVVQDDMGFGQTSGFWNVRYDGRVGSEAVFKNYSPDQLISLNNPLDLSELDEMDFSIDVSKFPPTHTGPYVGTMTLSAGLTSHLTCGS